MHTPTTTCKGKEAYRNYHTACRAMRRLCQERKAGRHFRFELYRCPYCSHYHLGTNFRPRIRHRRKDES